MMDVNVMRPKIKVSNVITTRAITGVESFTDRELVISSNDSHHNVFKC